MISLIVLTSFGALAAAGAIATVLVTARDGYRHVPSRRA
jgi:hypothetical protein